MLKQSGRWTAGPVTVMGILLALVPAEEASAAYSGKTGLVECAEALHETMRTSKPTVVVITSRTSTESIRLLESIERELLGRSIGPGARFAEMPVERYPERVERLGVREFPTLIAYGSRDGDLERLGELSGPSDLVRVAAWLGSLGLLGEGVEGKDLKVTRTGWLRGDRQATMTSSPPSPSPQQLAPAPPPHPSHTVSEAQAAMSSVITQESGPPVVVQPGAPSVYIQPQAPRIVIGQMPPPEVTVVQTTQSSPAIRMAIVSPTSATTPSYQASPLETPSPALSTPQASPQSMYPNSPPPSYPVSPTTTGDLTPHPQESLVAATAIALLLENPDLINAMIGALGKGFILIGKVLEKHSHPRASLRRLEASLDGSGALMLVPGQAAPGATVVPVMTMPPRTSTSTTYSVPVGASVTTPTSQTTTPTPAPSKTRRGGLSHWFSRRGR